MRERWTSGRSTLGAGRTRSASRRLGGWTAQSVVFLSGQAAISEFGEVVAPGDFAAQTRQVFENLQAVLSQAGATFESVVKLVVYVTDTSRLPDYARVKAEYIPVEQPASTAIGVASLALPGMMIEVDATAVL